MTFGGVILYELCNIIEHGLPQSLIFAQLLKYFISNEILAPLKAIPTKESTASYSYDRCYNNYFSSSYRPDSFISFLISALVKLVGPPVTSYLFMLLEWLPKSSYLILLPL